MRRRMIDPAIWSNDKFGFLSKDARLLFIGMITIADDEGRLKSLPRYLKAKIFPYDEITENEVAKALVEGVEQKLAHSYKNGLCSYCYLCGWHEHQSIRSDIKKISTLPAPKDLQERNGAVTPTLQERNGAVTPTLPNIIEDNQYKTINISKGVKDAPHRNKYGEFQNVLLSDNDYNKLKDKFGAELPDKIETLSLAIESKGYKYKDFYATILAWDRKDNKRKQGVEDEQPPTARRKHQIKRVTESSLRAAELAKRKNQ